MARAESIALQGEETRAMILDVAIELFGERGYRGCTLAQISARTGIVQSGLLHHFGSKERLLQEALNDHYPQLSERPEAQAVAAGTTTFRQEIDRVVRANAENPSLVRFFTVMAGESLTDDHPVQSLFVERYDLLRESVTNAVLAQFGLESPEAKARVALLVSITFATMDGLQAQWLRNRDVDLVGGMALIGRVVEAELESLRAPA